MPSTMGFDSTIYGVGMSADPDNPNSTMTSVKTNFMIDFLKSQLSNKGWTVGVQQSLTSFIFALPVVSIKAAIGSLIIQDFFGKGFQFYDPATETDPTGNFTVFGTYIVGIPTTPLMTQNDLIEELAKAMRETDDPMFGQPDVFYRDEDKINEPGSPYDGVYTTIWIRPHPEPAFEYGSFLNGYTFHGNTLGGGEFQGPTRLGGWNFTSQYANGDTQMFIRIIQDKSTNLRITTWFNNGTRVTVSTGLAPTTLSDVVLHPRSNYISLVDRYQLIIFPQSYESVTATNIDQVLIGTSDYWLCMPHVPEEYRYGRSSDPLDMGIMYCGFVAKSPRTQLNATNVAVCVNSDFVDREFNPALDCGMSMIVLNSMQNDEGPLLTTTELPITLSPLVALSPGNSLFSREHAVPYVIKPLALVGYIWDAFLLTQYAPLNTIMYKGGIKYFAYRSQRTPCECTLWVALHT